MESENDEGPGFKPLFNKTLLINSTKLFSIESNSTSINLKKPSENKLEEKSNENDTTTTFTEDPDNESEEEDANQLEDVLFSNQNDFVTSLLSRGDPGLVKVLMDNSKPENLDVFLENSNITLEQLSDFIQS